MVLLLVLELSVVVGLISAGGGGAVAAGGSRVGLRRMPSSPSSTVSTVSFRVATRVHLLYLVYCGHEKEGK